MKKHIRLNVFGVMILAALCMCHNLGIRETIQAGQFQVMTCTSGIMGNGINGITIDINGAPYSTIFASSQSGYEKYAYALKGCAWYASSRVNQLTGKGTTIRSGYAWYHSAYKELGFSIGTEPRGKSLACFGNHIAVVEAVDGGQLTVSQGGMSRISDEAHGYCAISVMSRESLESQSGCGTFYGYVYLDAVSSSSDKEESSSQKPSGEAGGTTDKTDTTEEMEETDTTKPIILDVYADAITSSGYRVRCTVKDRGNNLSYAQILTWVAGTGQENPVKKKIPLSGGVDQIDYQVKISDHNNQTNCKYVTHIYVYDEQGNEGSWNVGNIEIVSVPKIAVSKLSAGEKAFTVSWKTSKNVSGYQIQYAANASFQKAKKIKVEGAESSSLKITKVSADKKYYVRMRAFCNANGKTIYGSWSKKKGINTKK